MLFRIFQIIFFNVIINTIRIMDETTMSTKIDELPVPNFIKEEKEVIKEKIIQKEEKKDDKIKIEVSEKFSLFKIIKREINEENLFLLILFFILSISDINKYLSNIPYVGSYFEYESWSFILFKSLIFLLIFIIGKLYLLPKIQI